jgi:hypothetical protein
MDNDAASPSAGQESTTTRRRDRLRALVNLNSVRRRRNNVPLQSSTSRFSLASMFFPRRANVEDPRPASSQHSEHEQDHINSPIPPPSTATVDTGDLFSRLEALNDFFDEDHEAPPLPASPRNRASRRLSLRLRDLVDHRLLIPRNRAGIYIPNSPISCFLADLIILATAPSESQSRFSYHHQPDSAPSESPISPGEEESPRTMPQEPLADPSASDEPQPLFPPASANTALPTSNVEDNAEQAPSTFRRPRSVVEAQGATAPRSPRRRATWGAGRPWPTIRPSSFLEANDNTGTGVNGSTLTTSQSPLQFANTVRRSLSARSLASASPLSSLSSLFTRTTSNQSSNSTLTPGSQNELRSPPVFQPGAARLATPTTSASTSTSDTDMEQMLDNNGRRLGRMARVQTRLRRQMDSLLSRRDSEDMNDMDITTLLRNMRRHTRTRGSDGSSNDGEPIAEGMAPFTIVGIRRVNPGTEVTGEDNLPPYIRELLGSSNPTDDNAGSSNERRRPSNFRNGRRRGVLSFYDRMESTSREQALQMLQRRRPRSLYGAGSLRRNGVVGPDSPTERDDNLEDEDTDSTDTDETSNRDDPTYIIYLISGILPENHPLLSAPSLFTNNPTYEDMLYIASLLGPGKPPVASESDVASAPGLFSIEVDTNGKLFAVSRENNERIALPPVVEDGVERAERCLVCLSDYEAEEEARKLVRCGHLFHKDCIDHVSLPLL